MSETVLTGRKVFFILVAAFGVVISVNILLAYNAIKTFPGLVVKNSYVASQSFDAERAAQIALGWTVTGEVSNQQLRLSFRDVDGNAVKVRDLTPILGRTTNVASDQVPTFTFDGQDYLAPVDLAPGRWTLRLKATASDGTKFHQLVTLNISQDS